MIHSSYDIIDIDGGRLIHVNPQYLSQLNVLCVCVWLKNEKRARCVQRAPFHRNFVFRWNQHRKRDPIAHNNKEAMKELKS